MKLILVRHGNTFAPDDTIVMAGATEDYPLVEKGKQQAVNVAKFLINLIKAEDLQPETIISANLQRTQETAEILAKELLIPVEFNPRLNEIDYGSWSAKTGDEIRELGDGEALRLWNEKSEWPAAFKTQLTEVKTNLDAIVNTHHKDSTQIIISSNGILRYFLDYIPGEFEARIAGQDFKMKTGHVSLIEIGEESKVIFWNKNPKEQE